MKPIGLWLMLALLALPCVATEIRIRNDTDSRLSHVVVGDKHYGDIAPHATTAYQHWDLAYETASYSLLADSNPLMFQPHNYLREGELGRGKYTYVLQFKGGVLRIYAEKDAE